jgi:hypothetical protein
MMERMDAAHAQEEDQWRAVAQALTYTQVYLEERVKYLVGLGGHGVAHAENPKRSLEHAFMTWSKKYHIVDQVSPTAARWMASTTSAG